jgi:DNA modification methylase
VTAIAIVGNATDLILPNQSVHCVVTSPPYNCSVPYDGYADQISWQDYLFLAQDSAREMDRVLVEGGRVWINVPPAVPENPEGNLFRQSPLHIWHQALGMAGFTYRDTIVWRQDSHDGACAWGSWKRPSAPNLRGCWEAVLSFFKGPYKRTAPEGYEDYEDGYTSNGSSYNLGGEWTDLVRNVWDLSPARGSKYGPAPFPLELPARCIRLSTWPGEVVLDPFGGSGTTAKAASELGRVGVSVDISARQTAAAADRMFTLFS